MNFSMLDTQQAALCCSTDCPAGLNRDVSVISRKSSTLTGFLVHSLYLPILLQKPKIGGYHFLDKLLSSFILAYDYSDKKEMLAFKATVSVV
jgi:hypothetical protein